MKIKRSKAILAAIICLLGAAVSQTARVTAQAETPLALSLRRNFGFSSGSGDIQGNFTLRATPNQAVDKVVFYIDGELLGEDAAEPYELRFVTDNHPAGIHSLTAKGFAPGGQELDSNIIKVNFRTPESARDSTFSILGYVFGALLLVMIISWAIPTVLGKKATPLPPGAPRSYGIFGGAICPRCLRPFARSALGLNLVVGRLERCPHCGKWSLVHRASPEALRAAELAELDQLGVNPEVPTPSAEEHLRKELDDSRYQDL
ncbi:MAG TPA: Ig-like domain-containing protein [Anaerolineales bacterium]|nr:Ig-like domain-containing protein [Anaerolineales bacterium]